MKASKPEPDFAILSHAIIVSYQGSRGICHCFSLVFSVSHLLKLVLLKETKVRLVSRFAINWYVFLVTLFEKQIFHASLKAKKEVTHVIQVTKLV